jgi:Kef-type K+ transport system membrane component KefB
MVLEVSGSFFTQLGIIIIIVAILAYLLQLLKQPQLLAYILVGILITPILQLVTNNTIIDTISTIGVAFLLFIVGLEMDIKSLKNVALVTTVGGTIQIAILFTLGYIVALFL